MYILQLDYEKIENMASKKNSQLDIVHLKTKKWIAILHTHDKQLNNKDIKKLPCVSSAAQMRE